MQRNRQIRKLHRQLNQQRVELAKQLNDCPYPWASGLAFIGLTTGFIYQRMQPSAAPFIRFAAAQATRSVLLPN